MSLIATYKITHILSIQAKNRKYQEKSMTQPRYEHNNANLQFSFRLKDNKLF